MHPSSPSLRSVYRLNQLLFVTLMVSLLGVIMYKVIHVPITHDETATTVWYTAKFSVWEIMMYPDPWPNNHILNTLAVKALLGIWNPEQWVVRLPSVVAFLLYVYGVYRLLRYSITLRSELFMPLALLFFVNPYLIDFFCVSRGYSLSIALSILSMSYLYTGTKHDRNSQLWTGAVMAMLAAYANFTVLLYWCASVAICLGYFMWRYWKSDQLMLIKSVGMLAALSCLYSILIYPPIHKMSATNQFKYWDQLGFFKSTVRKSLKNAAYDAPWLISDLIEVLSYMVVVSAIMGLLKVGFRVGRSKSLTLRAC